MKKIFLTLLATTALFATSCSSDNDPIIDNPTDGGKIVNVSLNIKSAAYEIDKTPMRSLSDASLSDSEIRIVAYKNTGEVYSDTAILYNDFKSLLKEDGSFPFAINLREGNYHLAVVNNKVKANVLGDIISLYRWNPQSFENDTMLRGSGVGLEISDTDAANTNLYYNTVDVTASESNKEIAAIELQPMWSKATITFTDPKTFMAPANAKYVYIDIAPVTWDLNTKSKLAVTQATPASHNINGNGGLYSIEWLRTQNSFTYQFNISKTDADNNNMSINFKFYTEQDLATLLDEKTIDLKTQIENGQNYLISGKIGNITGVDQSMNITLGEFKNENIIIE